MTSTEVRSDVVLREVAELINGILEENGLGDIADEITADTVFHADLELQSIDLVLLAGLLEEKYGPSVRLASYMAELDAEQILGLTIGQIVDYVVRSTS